MSRRITITIEQIGIRDGAVATAHMESNTVGPGVLAEELALIAGRVTAMWSQVDASSAKPAAVRDAG